MSAVSKAIWRIEAGNAVSRLRQLAKVIDQTDGNDDERISLDELNAFTREINERLADSRGTAAEHIYRDAISDASAISDIIEDGPSLAEDLASRVVGAPVHYEELRDLMEKLFGARLPPSP
jgi:hypothetical protein